MRLSKPSTRGKEKKGDDDPELVLAESSETQARDEGILTAIHALRKDFSAQLQDVITSNQRSHRFLL